MSTLKYIISSNTEWAIEDIDDQDNIYYDINISSLEFFYIIYDVEEYFDVSFSAHEYAEARYETVYQLYLRIYDNYFN